MTAARPCLADGFENVPTGARTAAMGGAGIAGGYDSAMPTLNPAGLALVPGSIASISASLYQLAGVTIPNYVADEGGTVASQWGDLQASQSGVLSREFGTFPSGLAYFLHFGDQQRPYVLAASISVPQSVRRRFVQSVQYRGGDVSLRNNLTTVVQRQSYAFATSGATAFGPLRIGVSAVLGYSTLLRSTDTTGLSVLGTEDFERHASRSTTSAYSVDVAGLLGAQYDITKGFKIGLSLRSPSTHLGGNLDSTTDNSSVTIGAPAIVTSQRTGDAVFGIPLRIGVGAALSGDGWGLALDGRLYLPRDDEFRVSGTRLQSAIGIMEGRGGSSGEFNQVSRKEKVFNVSLGTEIRLTEVNWLRAGVFTDFSAARGAQQQLDRILENTARSNRGAATAERLIFEFPIDQIGASAGWGTRLGPIDTTIGLQATYGTGDTVRETTAVGPTLRKQPAEITNAMVYDILAFVSATVDVNDGVAKLVDGTSKVGE